MTDIWLRLTKTGDSYAGEYSLDGTAWTALASPVTNAMADPDFGLFAIAPQAQGDGTLVPFEYFTLDGPDPIGVRLRRVGRRVRRHRARQGPLERRSSARTTAATRSRTAR